MKIEMKMKVRMKCYDNESKNEMTMKIEIVGGWGGFPPIKIKFIENWNENESESENEMIMRVRMKWQ